MTPIYQHAPFHGKGVKVMPGDVVACRADRWRVGIVLKVREDGWYDVAEWLACDKMKDIDEVRRHFALRQTLPSSGPSSQKCG